MVLKDAVIIVIEKESRYLFVQRGPAQTFAGFWGPISGKLEVGETQAQAVVREAQEEVGVTVKPVRKFAEFVTPNGQYLIHWWVADWISGEATPQDEEVAAVRWVRLEEMEQIRPHFEEHPRFFRMLVAKG